MNNFVFTLMMLISSLALAQDLNFRSVDVLKASVNELNTLSKILMSSKNTDLNSEKTRKLTANLVSRTESLTQNIQSDIGVLSKRSSLTSGEQLLLQEFTKTLENIGNITKVISVKFGIPTDKNGNFRQASVDVSFSDLATLKLESPKHLRYRLSELGRKAGEFGINLSTQYVYFQMALGILTAAQLGFEYQKNPISFQLLKESATDPVAIAGFGVFMLAQHKVARMLDGVRSGIIPKSTIPYISMSAGMIASSYFSELISDKDLMKCASSNARAIVGRGQSDDEACGKAWSNQALSGRIIQFAPMITSLIITTVASTKLFEGAAKGIQSLKTVKAGLAAEAEAGTISRIGISGLKILNGAAKLRQAASFAGGPIVAIANFVLFLGLDSFVAPILTKSLNKFNLLNVDIKAAVDSFWSRREILWLSGYKSKDGRFIPSNVHDWDIQDSFDVKATNFSSAHQFYLNMLRDGNQTRWSSEPDVTKCEQAKSSVFNTNNSLGRFLDSRFSRMKTDSQMRCEIASQPLRVISRLGEQSKAWRDFILSDYLESMDLWQRLVLNFSQQMAISRETLEYFSKSKTLGQGFSLEDLVSSLKEKNITIRLRDEENTEALGFPKSFLGQKIRDPIEYTLMGLACGTDDGKFFDKGSWYERLLAWWDSSTNNRTGLVSTYGSEFRFLPPKIVNNVSKICSRLFVAQQLIVQNAEFTRERANPPELSVNEKNYWIDDSGNSYKSLGELIMSNLKPELFNKDKNNKILPWGIFWENKVMTAVRQKWSVYDSFFKKLITTKLAPNIFSRKVERGWDLAPKPQVSKDLTWKQKDTLGFYAQIGRSDRTEFRVVNPTSLTFMVANGLVPAMEIQTRNNLIGLLALLRVSPVSQETRKQLEKDFVKSANGYLSAFRTNQNGPVEALEASLSERMLPAAAVLNEGGLELGRACLTEPEKIDGTFPDVYKARLASQLCNQIWSALHERNMLVSGYYSTTSQFKNWLEGTDQPVETNRAPKTGNIMRDALNK